MDAEYQMLILDVELPDMKGIDLLPLIPRQPPTIICTAHSEFALKAFELGVVDYLLKPYTLERFRKSVIRLIDTARNSASFSDSRPIGISVREGDSFHFIPFHEILFITARGKRSVVHTIKTEYISSQLLTHIMGKLPERFFMRVHKQFIINLQFISHLQHMTKGDYLAFMRDEDQSQIPVSRNYAPELKARIGMN